MAYINCNNRVACSSKNLLNTSPGYFEYRTALNTVIRPNTICAGSGPGNLSCSHYGTVRRTVGGLNGIQDPTLIQRSYFSSGCAPSALNEFPDTLDQPVKWKNQVAGININKGGNLTGFHTRNFQTNYSSVNENPKYVDRFLNVGSSWTNGYHGLNSVDGNKSSRLIESCRINKKYRQLADTGISAASFGSYGI